MKTEVKSDGENEYALPLSRGTLPNKLAGYVFGIVCLVWVFYSVDFANLVNHVRQVVWPLVLLAILLDILSYLIQGLRWSLLLRSVGRVSVLETTQAIFTGLFVNEVLPLKMGELVRGYLISQLLKTGFLRVLSTMVVERCFDGIWLVSGIAVATCFVTLPPKLLKAEEMLGAIIVLAVGIFVLLSRRGGKSSAQQAGTPTPHGFIPHGLARFLAAGADFGSQIARIGRRTESLIAFLLSSIFILLQAAAFWLVMRAYHIEISIWAGAAVFLIVHLSSALPAAPANVGSYQFFTVLGLTLFGVDKTIAAGFSIVVFVMLTIPLWILGFLALGRSGLTLWNLRDAVKDIYQPRHS